MWNRDESITGICVGFLAGASVGLAVGILMAPQSGARTRRLLRKRAEDATCAVKDRVDSLQDDIHDVQNTITDKARHARDYVRESAKTASDYFEKVRARA